MKYSNSKAKTITLPNPTISTIYCVVGNTRSMAYIVNLQSNAAMFGQSCLDIALIQVVPKVG